MQDKKKRFLEAFAVALRQARGKRSQADFAALLGLSNQQAYNRYENMIAMPSAAALHQIATRMGVTVDKIFENPDCIFQAAKRMELKQLIGDAYPDSNLATANSNWKIRDAIRFIADQFDVSEMTLYSEMMELIGELVKKQNQPKV